MGAGHRHENDRIQRQRRCHRAVERGRPRRWRRRVHGVGRHAGHRARRRRLLGPDPDQRARSGPADAHGGLSQPGARRRSARIRRRTNVQRHAVPTLGCLGRSPPEVPVAVKNGWLPVANGWEINSIGHVSGGLHDYVVAVLSVGSPSMNDGISTVEGVSSLVWSDLAAVSVVDEHYAALGGAEGFMGQPTGPELGTPDGVGRYRGYQGGATYWSPASGAHEVHGKIYDAWAAHGWEAGQLGYPVTDELGTPDGVGRFSHFTNGSTYWTVAAGAHEVYGAIRAQWAALGWENGPLGYPVSDEHDVTGGRAGSFQGGDVITSATTGTHAVYGDIDRRYRSMSP